MRTIQPDTPWFASGVREFAKARFDKCIEHFSLALDDDGANPLVHVSRGAAYLKLGLFDAARSDFDRAIALDADYARAYHLRGLISEKQGDDAAALADFDRAIDLDPGYGAAYYSRATIHTRLAHGDEAQHDIEMVAHLGNQNMESWMTANNVWRTEHMRLEDALGSELQR